MFGFHAFFSSVTRASAQHPQLGSLAVVFRVGSVDGVASDVTYSNLVRSAVLTHNRSITDTYRFKCAR